LDSQFWFRDIINIEREEQPFKKESNEVLRIPLDNDDEEGEEFKEDKN